jgi:23S rRNA (uracil1939-C5)-methyltransferase
VEAIESASRERIDPPCPHFPACGGCALQHLFDPSYAVWKAGLLDAALRRAGFSPVLAPMARTPPGARRRMDFAVRKHGAAVTVGLHAARSPATVDLANCVVLATELVALIEPLREILRRISGLRHEGSAIANLLDSGFDLLLRGEGALTTADRSALTAFARENGIARISWAAGRGAVETACQLRPAVTLLSGMSVAPPPGAFFQASAQGEAAIVSAVLAGLPEKLPAKARVADLFSGLGTLTFPLARRLRVDAFEGDAASAASCRTAIGAGGLAGRVAATRRDLVRQPLSAKEFSAYSVVVLDPPHAGAAEQIGEIARSKVPRVIYVSCNPTTLARDARVLREAGYELRAATPVDQFLWSARLESVCVFSR